MSLSHGSGTCHFLGHSHMDAAWLWPLSETKEVFAKTCETILALMERYPGFRFCQSSAQYYQWLEEEHPILFERVRRRVSEGRWELVGGTWVEPDGNLPSGESFVRQYLYGKRYFKDKFGVDVRIAWMPDSFGYAWTLPQIMRKSGMDMFLTQKMSWNDATVFPYFFFTWTGPDGSSIQAHQTVGSYSETVTDERILQQMSRLRLCQSLDDLLVLFGKGDHGGGITEDMIKRALEYVNGNKPMKGTFTTAKDYFKVLGEKTRGKEVPEVCDELYLQYHRGTYTTQAGIKKNNRKAECLLEAAEKFSTIAQRFGCEYPSRSLEEAWKRLLLNQFHDVLPGSSIPQVYEDSRRDFKHIFEAANSALSKSLKAIAGQVDTTGEGASVLVFNPLSWPRNGVVEVPLNAFGGGARISDDQGKAVPSQVIDEEENRERRILFRAEQIPSIGYREYRVKGPEGRRPSSDLSARATRQEIRLENEFLVVRVDIGTGMVKSIYDKAMGKEALADAGNRLQVFEDSPTRGRVGIVFQGDAEMFDAWEIYIYQQHGGVRLIELDKPLKIELVESGPVRAKIRVEYKYSQEGRPDSRFVQDIVLHSGDPVLSFRLRVNWHAAHRLVKVAFPMSIHGEFTSYEAPYGFVRRRNPLSPDATLDERAKWEVPGQKWMDYTGDDGRYGVSLLNDCKYGFDMANNVVRMTLLRSPHYPEELRAHFGLPVDERGLGELTDQGEHSISYGLYLHKLGFAEASTVRRAYEFNYPPLPLVEESHEGALPKAHSFYSAWPENVILTVIKKTEDTGDIILRFYEASGKDVKAVISADMALKTVWKTNLMEQGATEMPTSGRDIEVSISRHAIETLKIRYA
jgi:alpha-mannosidase